MVSICFPRYPSPHLRHTTHTIIHNISDLLSQLRLRQQLIADRLTLILRHCETAEDKVHSLILACVSYSTVVLYIRDHGGLGAFYNLAVV